MAKCDECKQEHKYLQQLDFMDDDREVCNDCYTDIYAAYCSYTHDMIDDH